MTSTPLDLLQIFFGFLFAVGLIISVFAYKVKEGEYGYGLQPPEPGPSPPSWTLQVSAGSPSIFNNSTIYLNNPGDAVNTVQNYDTSVLTNGVMMSVDIDTLFPVVNTTGGTATFGFYNVTNNTQGNTHAITITKTARFAYTLTTVDNTGSVNLILNSTDISQLSFNIVLTSTRVYYYRAVKNSSSRGTLLNTSNQIIPVTTTVYNPKLILSNTANGPAQFTNFKIDTDPNSPYLGLVLGTQVYSDFNTRGYARLLTLGVVLMTISVLLTLRRTKYI